MTTAKGALTKERIFKAAIKLINEHGYDNVSVASICQEAQVSNGSFFHLFKTKADILLEFVREESDLLEAYYLELDKNDAIDAFRKIIAWQAGYYKLKGEDFISHLHANRILSKRNSTFDYSLGKVLGSCIELGQQQKVMRADVNAYEAGQLFFNDILAYTSWTCWPDEEDRTIEDALIERGEVYLRFLAPKAHKQD